MAVRESRAKSTTLPVGLVLPMVTMMVIVWTAIKVVAPPSPGLLGVSFTTVAVRSTLSSVIAVRTAGSTAYSNSVGI